MYSRVFDDLATAAVYDAEAHEEIEAALAWWGAAGGEL
jgi:hypothetical protein